MNDQEMREAFKTWYASHRPHDCWSAWQEATRQAEERHLPNADGILPESADFVRGWQSGMSDGRENQRIEDDEAARAMQASDDVLRLALLIADKIEDGTLFDSGIYRRAELAEIVRKVICARPAMHEAYPEIAMPLDDDVREALLFALWNHQGGSSRIGQPIRQMLGIGKYEDMTEPQYAAAKRVQAALAYPAKAEPVAWALRINSTVSWTFRAWREEDKSFERDLLSHGWETLRLYAAPTPSVDQPTPPSDDELLDTFRNACNYSDRCNQGHSYGRAQALRAVLARYGNTPTPTPGAVLAKQRELTDSEIDRGWRDTFSTDNPFCPCNLKSFTKAVRWAECVLAKKGGAA